MGAWDEFNSEFNMTDDDWAEWRKTKYKYRRGGIFSCVGCGSTITTSPLITFLVVKGKKKLICSKCEDKKP